MDTISHASPDLYATPDNPVPDGHRVGFFRSHDGLQLRYAVFRSQAPVAKGTVVLLQGRNECIEKYFETIRDLTAEGLWVATFDFRGQGGSQRLLADARRGHLRRFCDYERDLDAFLEQVVLPDTRLPFFIVAHSTGALMALSSAPRLANRIERMALASPFLGLAGQFLSFRLVHTLASLACLAGLGGRPLNRDVPERPFDGNPLTSDAARFRRNRALLATHPQLALGPPTARWLYEALSAIQRISRPQHLTAITIPTILLAPTQDGVVPYADQERLSRHFRACQLIPIPGARHELFQERDVYRAQAMAAIAAFIPGGDTDAAGPDADATA